MDDKRFPYEKRNFETRVSFIRDIFVSKHTAIEIMARCIQYRLGKSYESYMETLADSMWNLHGEDPMKILKRIDK